MVSNHLSSDVLVIKRAHLFPVVAHLGLECSQSLLYYESLLKQHMEFIPRADAEIDETYKQIIPYLVFSYKTKIFIMQRKSTATEQRLAHKFSLGIGGHLHRSDIDRGDSLFLWAEREFHEEVLYPGAFSVQFLGVVNDDGSSVGRVHAGFVFLLRAESDLITIRDEHLSGELIELESSFLKSVVFEPWSKFIYEFFMHKKQIFL